MISLRRNALTGAIAGLLAAFAVCLAATAGELVNKDDAAVAILGYDPVAYFTDGKPVKGKADFEYVWHDAKWRFASARHRDLFAGDPQHYAPRYGGFCAGAMSRGFKASIDPKAWVIIDGRLYLSYAKRYIKEFAKDPPKNIAKADANWKRLGRTN